jgi:aryl-alcohol dehydrogenase-like predicted oxidoreductase
MDLAFVMSNFQPDLIQVPLNLVDQRFLKNSTLENAKFSGVEIHARSIFLQGLLLLPPSFWPEKFQVFETEVKKIYEFCILKNISFIELCFQFLNSLSFVDAAIVGVQSYTEFKAIKNLLMKKKLLMCENVDWSIFASKEQLFRDPRNWTSL